MHAPRSCKSAGAHNFTFTEKLGTYVGSVNNSVESRSQSMQGSELPRCCNPPYDYGKESQAAWTEPVFPDAEE